MISTPFSCNTPSCVCRVFVSVSKPLVQQDPGVRKTKETQSRNPIPGHMPFRNVVHWRIFSLVASSFLASSSLCYSQQRLYLLICFSPNHWTDGGFIREQFSWSGQNNGALIRVPPAATAGQRFLWIPNMEQLPLSWSACGMSTGLLHPKHFHAATALWKETLLRTPPATPQATGVTSMRESFFQAWAVFAFHMQSVNSSSLESV